MGHVHGVQPERHRLLLGRQLLGLGTDLQVNSPATDELYTPNPTYPDWIYDVIYEVKIAKAAFGPAGFGSIEMPYIHASPSKAGTNTIYRRAGPLRRRSATPCGTTRTTTASRTPASRASTACS